jgi:hypothetical protein
VPIFSYFVRHLTAMSFFQQSVLKKYTSELDKENLAAAWKIFQAHFHNPAMQENIYCRCWC